MRRLSQTYLSGHLMDLIEADHPLPAHDTADTARETLRVVRTLWDALSWVDTHDPETAAMIEKRFNLDINLRTVIAP